MWRRSARRRINGETSMVMAYCVADKTHSCILIVYYYVSCVMCRVSLRQYVYMSHYYSYYNILLLITYDIV